MKVNELRVGNLVYVINCVEVVITADHIKSISEGDTDYSPIPLTPECLERCGFEKDRNGWNIPGTQFSLTEKFYPCWMDRMLWPQDVPDFKHQSLQYLHQLQNLYFALTGEELQIKMP